MNNSVLIILKRSRDKLPSSRGIICVLNYSTWAGGILIAKGRLVGQAAGIVNTLLAASWKAHYL